MSRMVGADPDALDRLAADFDRGAGSLEQTAARVRTSVHANPWSGARATRFRTDWDQRHAPMLKRTALALRTAAKQLRLQAQEQRQASSASGGSTVPSTTSGGPRDRVTASSPFGSWEDLQKQFQLEFGLLGVLGAAGTLGTNSSLVGRYPASWAALTDRMASVAHLGKLDLSDEVKALMAYKRSFNGMFSVNGLGEKIDNIPGLGKLGALAGGIDLAVKASDFATDPSLLGASETVAAALKTSKHPVAYLGGMALSSINMAADAASETDWSKESFDSTFAYVREQGAGVVVEELGKATVEVFTKRIWSIF